MDAPHADRLLAAVRGNREALAELLAEFGPQVRARIAGQLHSDLRGFVDADDVMQVTYLEAFLRIERFEPRGAESFLSWLAQIARNNLRDAARSQQRAKRPPAAKRIAAASDGETTVAALERLFATLSTPSRRLAAREVQEALEQALQRLPEDYALVVRRCDLAGEPAADVAARLGRTVGAVYMLRARALDRLREQLGSASRFLASRP